MDTFLIPLLETLPKNGIDYERIITVLGASIISAASAIGAIYIKGRIELLQATNSNRHEVYKRKFDVYRNLNKMISTLFQLSIKAALDKNKKDELTEASKQLQEFNISNSMIISPEIGQLLFDISHNKEDPESTRKTFNLITGKMDKELNLGETHKINKRAIDLLKEKILRK